MTAIGFPAASDGSGRSSRLYRDAAALASSSMLTAVLGAGFWALCAGQLSPRELGVQTALMSIITAPAIVVASGMGDAFNAIVPASGPQRAAVVVRGYRIVLVASIGLGVVAGIVATTVLAQVRGSIPVALLVMVGVVIWSLFVLQDQALTSLHRARWLPLENGITSLLKIGLLATAIAIGVAEPVVLASLLPCVLAVAVLFPQVRRLSLGPADPARVVIVDAPFQLERLAKRTTISIALSLGALTLTPFIVAAAAGPTEGAVFSIGLAITQSLDFVGAALGVSLVTHTAGASDGQAAMAFRVFKRTVAIVGMGAVGLVLVAPRILPLLNDSYSDLHGAQVITILVIGSVARTGYVIWASLQRARRRMRELIVLNATAAGFVLVTLAPVAARWGAVGAAGTILVAQLILTTGAGVHLLKARGRAG